MEAMPRLIGHCHLSIAFRPEKLGILEEPDLRERAQQRLQIVTDILS